jgi:hypothetical protein
MSKNVFANGMEVSCKKDDNKSICAMADTCLSPPSPPAGPLPVPYPNTAQASDTTDGSKSVKIGGAEVGMKNSSSYKKSTGDEAATKTLGMGVVTHNIQGKMKHTAWSFDVMVEGANAIRHMDMTTHNHINQPNIAAGLNQAAQNTPINRQMECSELEQENENIRNNNLDPVTQNGQPVPAGQEGPPAPQPAVVSTTASFMNAPGVPGGGSFMRAVTSQGWVQNGADGFAPARPAGQRVACTNDGFAPGFGNHTEPKLIGQIFDRFPMGAPRGALGTLRMNVGYQGRGLPAPRNNFVCNSCKKLICKSIDCGLNIELCENGQLVTTSQVRERCVTRRGWPPEP